MGSPLEIVRAVRAAGLSLAVVDGRLKVGGPAAALSGMAPTIQAHRAELVAWLQAPTDPRIEVVRSWLESIGESPEEISRVMEQCRDPYLLEGFYHLATTPDQPPATKKQQAVRPRPEIHPAALLWLRAHREELKAAGFTAPELWRRNRSPGIAWLTTVWQRPGLAVALERGVIVFRYRRHDGTEIQQTARPVPQRVVR